MGSSVFKPRLKDRPRVGVETGRSKAQMTNFLMAGDTQSSQGLIPTTAEGEVKPAPGQQTRVTIQDKNQTLMQGYLGEMVQVSQAELDKLVDAFQVRRQYIQDRQRQPGVSGLRTGRN